MSKDQCIAALRGLILQKLPDEILLGLCFELAEWGYTFNISILIAFKGVSSIQPQNNYVVWLYYLWKTLRGIVFGCNWQQNSLLWHPPVALFHCYCVPNFRLTGHLVLFLIAAMNPNFVFSKVHPIICFILMFFLFFFLEISLESCFAFKSSYI